jgi:hypothetical protein
MTMPNGAQPKPVPVQRGQHVQPSPLSFEASARLGNTPQGPVRMVVLRFETVVGSIELVMPSDFASQVGQAVIKASSGIEIARP